MANSLSLENDSSSQRGYIKVNGTTAATFTAGGLSTPQATIGSINGLLKATNGTVSQAVSGVDFLSSLDFTGTNQSLSTSGYQKLPGGLIIQWGDFPTTSGSQISVSRTFPITFPNSVLAFSCTAFTNNRSGNALNIWSVYNYTTSGFTGRTQDNDSTPYEGWWIAIGY